MDVQTAKTIPIDQLLQRLGCERAMTRRGSHWYRSPTRIEKTPSFKLTPDGYGWYDHGTGEGGNILDLAYRLHTGLPLAGKLDGGQVKKALAFIENVTGFTGTITPSVERVPLMAAEPHAFTLLKHKPFAVYGRGSSLTPAALYLGTRGVNAEQVAPYLEDITFVGNDTKKRYGFGIPNVSGGYEIRRYGDWAKRSVGTKDVTIFKAERAVAPWHTFYSLIDFCTFITVDKPPTGAYNYLIINSDSLVDKAITYLDGWPAGFMIHYPHGDESGQRAYQKVVHFLGSQGWISGDKAHLYTGHKDWTEAREKQLGLRTPVVQLLTRSTPPLKP